VNGWRNWAGNVVCPNAEIVRPHDEAELVADLRRARLEGRVVRPAGQGHSFSPLIRTDDLVVDLAAFSGVIDIDSSTSTAWVGAGSPIHVLGAPLWHRGLSLANQGDIDTQSIGGAVATGTHGTGPALGCLSTVVDAVRLVLADGTVTECSRDSEPELFEVARLSLGAVGLAVAVRLRLVPAYHLHERTWTLPVAECLGELDQLVSATRHFEFFWSPTSDRCLAKALQPHPGPVPAEPLGRFERIDRAYRVFPSVRSNRFVEMEYAVPAEDGPSCFAELRRLMQTRHRDVTWPVEYRTLAADDTLVGPAAGRPTVTLSVHQSVAIDHRRFFADAETVFRAHGGRPHWGKLHSAGAAELARLVPGWERFWSIVDRYDPTGRFRNDVLAGLRP
jgi:FAD/FMN-containing dehydrogenase